MKGTNGLRLSCATDFFSGFGGWCPPSDARTHATICAHARIQSGEGAATRPSKPVNFGRNSSPSTRHCGLEAARPVAGRLVAGDGGGRRLRTASTRSAWAAAAASPPTTTWAAAAAGPGTSTSAGTRWRGWTRTCRTRCGPTSPADPWVGKSARRLPPCPWRRGRGSAAPAVAPGLTGPASAASASEVGEGLGEDRVDPSLARAPRGGTGRRDKEKQGQGSVARDGQGQRWSLFPCRRLRGVSSVRQPVRCRRRPLSLTGADSRGVGRQGLGRGGGGGGGGGGDMRGMLAHAIRGEMLRQVPQLLMYGPKKL